MLSKYDNYSFNNNNKKWNKEGYLNNSKNKYKNNNKNHNKNNNKNKYNHPNRLRNLQDPIECENFGPYVNTIHDLPFRKMSSAFYLSIFISNKLYDFF